MNRRYSIGYLTTTATRIVQAEQNESIVIRDLIMCNASGSNQHFTIYHVPAGETPHARFSLYGTYHLTANNTLVVRDVRIYLAPGDAIWAFADTGSAITLHAYGTSSTGAMSPLMAGDG